MSILTWRDVSTPDFGASVFAQRNANDSMNNAFASLQSSLQGYKDAKADVADRNILTRMSAYQDPDQLKAALADGSLLGNNSQFAHPSLLANLPKQVGDVLQNAVSEANIRHTNTDTANTEQQMKQNALQNLHTNQLYDNEHQLSPVIADLTSKYSGQGPKGISTAVSELENNSTFGLLPADRQAALRAQLTSGISAPVTAGNDLFNSIEAGKQAQAKVSAEDFMRQLEASDQGKTQGGIYDAVTSQKDPRIQELLKAHYNTQYPGLFDSAVDDLSMGKGPTGLIGGADFDAEHTLFAPGKYSYNAPTGGWSNTSVDEARTLGNQMKIANKDDVKSLDKAGNLVPTGSSAQGQYMMINETRDRAAKALWDTDSTFRARNTATGAKTWGDVKLTPQNQEDMARYTFEQIPKTPEALKGTWDSLHPDDLAVIKANNYDWNVARPLIIARENGLSLDAMVNRMATTQEARDLATTGLNQLASSNPYVADYHNFVSAGSKDEYSAADNAKKISPALANMDRETLAKNIKSLVNNAFDANGNKLKVSPDQAALAISKSVYADSMFSGMNKGINNTLNPDNPLTSFNGNHIDLTKAADNLTEIARPDTATKATEYNKHLSALNTLPVADQFTDDKMKEFQRISALHARDKGRSPEINTLYGRALANLGVANAFQGQLTNNALTKNPIDVPPPPVQEPAKNASQVLSQALANSSNNINVM